MHRSLRSSALIPPGLIVDQIHADPQQVTITVHSGYRSGVCRSCGTISSHVHSHYLRRVVDLPLAGRPVQFLIRARRFRCDALQCGQRIFTERFAPDVIARHARRTARLERIVHHLGLALGGRPATRLVLSQILGTDSTMPEWLVNAYAASSSNCSARDGCRLWAYFACPLRIMWIISMPPRTGRALFTALNPSMGRIRLLTAR